jgi:hypothetical protein
LLLDTGGERQDSANQVKRLHHQASQRADRPTGRFSYFNLRSVFSRSDITRS